MSAWTVQATLRPPAKSSGRGEIRAELTGHSVAAFRHCVSSLRHELGRYHRHHRQRGSRGLAGLLRRPASAAVGGAGPVRVASDDQAVQNGPSSPWQEESLLLEPPAPSGPIVRVRPRRLIGLDYVDRHSPRGPPFIL